MVLCGALAVDKGGKELPKRFINGDLIIVLHLRNEFFSQKQGIKGGDGGPCGLVHFVCLFKASHQIGDIIDATMQRLLVLLRDGTRVDKGLEILHKDGERLTVRARELSNGHARGYRLICGMRKV